VVGGKEKDQEIGRDQEATVILLEDGQKSARGVIRQEKSLRLQKPNVIKANECCKGVVGQLWVPCTSMTRSDIDYE
jgi:hypothetical protein